MRRLVALLLCACVALLIPGCGGADAAGPPRIRLGRDECAGCGMIISESKSSCALIVDSEGGREGVAFDDLGCLLDHCAENPGAVVIATFVHDYSNGVWAGADSAVYLAADPRVLDTPMGSGLAAFALRDSAEAERGRVGGDVVDFTRLTALRAEWRDARRAAARGTP